MKKLYKFLWECGREGNVEGLFVAGDEELYRMIGRRVYFGEILGKHSEVEGILGSDDLTILSDDQDRLKWLVDLIGSDTISGHNPLHHISIDCKGCGTLVLDCGSWYDHEIIYGEYFCLECFALREK